MTGKSDGKTGRIVAALVLALGVGAFAYLNRESFIAPPPAEEEIVRPELMACLERRLGAVENMRAEDLLNDTQYEMFRGRAETFCLYQFGGANSAPPPQ